MAAPATLEYGQQDSQYTGQPSGGNGASRVFSDFSIYKGKSACTLKVISPTFSPTQRGDYQLSKQGALLLEFANAQEGTGNAPGQRRYDWNNKQTFALSPVEFSSLVEPAEQRIIHDPDRNRPTQGQTVKSLSFQPAQGGDWFLGLNVKRPGGDAKVNIPISRAELACLRTLSITIVPHLLGLDEVMNRGISVSGGQEDQSYANQPNY